MNKPKVVIFILRTKAGDELEVRIVFEKDFIRFSSEICPFIPSIDEKKTKKHLIKVQKFRQLIDKLNSRLRGCNIFCRNDIVYMESRSPLTFENRIEQFYQSFARFNNMLELNYEMIRKELNQ